MKDQFGRLFIVGPHTQYMNNAIIGVNVVAQSMLDIDASGVAPGHGPPRSVPITCVTRPCTNASSRAWRENHRR